LDALAATNLTTSAWNHSIFAFRVPAQKSAMLDGPCATFSPMFLGTKVADHSTFPNPKKQVGDE
jgi:hypothetical protein